MTGRFEIWNNALVRHKMSFEANEGSGNETTKGQWKYEQFLRWEEVPFVDGMRQLQSRCSRWWSDKAKEKEEGAGLEQQGWLYLCLPPVSSHPPSSVGPFLSGWDPTGCWLGTVSGSPCHSLKRTRFSLCEFAPFSSALDPVCLVKRKCQLIRHWRQIGCVFATTTLPKFGKNTS